MTATGDPVAALPRFVRDLGEMERQYAEADHELCEDGDPHSLEAHEPFDVLEGDESWESFTARLARHGLVLVSADMLAEALDYIGASEIEKMAWSPFKMPPEYEGDPDLNVQIAESHPMESLAAAILAALQDKAVSRG
jgi:hypothetical protein